MSVNNPGSSAFLPLTSTSAGVAAGATIISAGTNANGLIIAGAVGGADSGPSWDTAAVSASFGPIYVPSGVAISTGDYNGKPSVMAGGIPLGSGIPGDLSGTYVGHALRYRLL